MSTLVALFVKICGLCDPTDLEGVLACAPDAIGFVFWPPSPRAVTPERVREWTASWPSEALRVGVFVNASADEVARAADLARLDVIQLHAAGDPSPYRRGDRLLWQVRRLAEGPTMDNNIAAPDAYVLDSATPARPGGTGIPVDWDRAADFVRGANRPVLLAGGLTPANVADAARRVAPWGVDVSSGVEARPGRKDLEKVREFIRQCRAL